MKPGGWNAVFDDPIPLPAGGTLKTLRQARDHIAKLDADTELASIYLELAATRDRAWIWFARRWVYVAIHGDAPAPPRPPRSTATADFRKRRRAWKDAQATNDKMAPAPKRRGR